MMGLLLFLIFFAGIMCFNFKCDNKRDNIVDNSYELVMKDRFVKQVEEMKCDFELVAVKHICNGRFDYDKIFLELLGKKGAEYKDQIAASIVIHEKMAEKHRKATNDLISMATAMETMQNKTVTAEKELEKLKKGIDVSLFTIGLCFFVFGVAIGMIITFKSN